MGERQCPSDTYISDGCRNTCGDASWDVDIT